MVLDSDATEAVEAFRILQITWKIRVYEIVGRISRMYKVVKVKPKVARKLELEDHDWCATDRADIDWISLAYQDTKELGIIPFSTLIIKDLWLIKDKAAAEVGQSMLRGVSCCIGVPEVLVAYEFWEEFHRQGSSPGNHQDRGKRSAQSGYCTDLLKAILHATLGLYSVYLNGWIHGDVNISSVLLLAQPEMRCIDNLLCLGPERRQLLSKCIGMLVDDNQGIKEGTLFDTMKEVSERVRPVNTGGVSSASDMYRPGRLPFMSIRLLQALVFPTRTIITVIDDLESFIWVLCWTVSEVCLRRRKLNICEEILRHVL
ncbi:hypothetical protein EDD85DRAFT_1006439 [Armillaria nabsnona]|nr:hypothetical protein EDD85DRAFT_1006439 [Armillaria nabsnona]